MQPPFITFHERSPVLEPPSSQISAVKCSFTLPFSDISLSFAFVFSIYNWYIAGIGSRAHRPVWLRTIAPSPPPFLRYRGQPVLFIPDHRHTDAGSADHPTAAGTDRHSSRPVRYYPQRNGLRLRMDAGAGSKSSPWNRTGSDTEYQRLFLRRLPCWTVSALICFVLRRGFSARFQTAPSVSAQQSLPAS